MPATAPVARRDLLEAEVTMGPKLSGVHLTEMQYHCPILAPGGP
jgi:hypothetical protein